MRFTASIDVFVDDMRSQGRIRSKATERDYGYALACLADEVSNRDPRLVGREDVKRVLRRWPHPNSQRKMRSIYVSFFDWMMEEGLRDSNPARQTRRPRRVKPEVYRLTHDEALAILRAAQDVRERRIAYLGICAGLRRKELLGLQGRHFARPGWIWISSDIAKGSRERWVPVIADLEPIVAEIRANVAADEYVLPAQRWRDPTNQPGVKRDYTRKPSSPQALFYAVRRLGERAGIAAPIHPHLLRHAFADFIARFAGMRNAQAMLGHASVGTTEDYLGQPSLDDLKAAVTGFSLGLGSPTPALSLVGGAESSVEAPTGFEPVYSTSSATARLVDNSPEGIWLAGVLDWVTDRGRFYREAVAR